MSDTVAAATPVESSSAPPVSSGPATSDDITEAVFASLEGKAESADEASSAPSSDETAPSAAATIAPPVPSAEPAPEAIGPIPFDRHKAALDNARTKAAEEATAALRQKWGWAEQYDPQTVEQSTRLYSWLTANPQGFHEFLGQQLAAAGRPTQAPEPPAPDLRAEDGTPVYSAGQMQKLLAFQQQQLWAQVEQQYGPLKQKAEQAELSQQVDQLTRKTLTEARSNWPLFSDLEGDIKQRMLANQALSLYDAYVHALRENGLTRLQEQWKAQYQGAMAQKQSATTARPGVPVATPRNYKNMTPDEITAAVFDDLEAGR